MIVCLKDMYMLSEIKQRLAKFKVPKRVFHHEELPRNAMGKVQKAELRTQYGALFKA